MIYNPPNINPLINTMLIINRNNINNLIIPMYVKKDINNINVYRKYQK